MTRTKGRRTVSFRAISQILVFILLFAACGGNTDEPETSEATSSTAATDMTQASPTTSEGSSEGDLSGELTFWFLDDPSYDQAWWDQLVADFREAYPNVQVNYSKYDTNGLIERTVNAFATGEPPDVFFNNGGEELNKFVRRDQIEAVDELADLSFYNPALIEYLRFTDGLLYGVPVGFGTPVVIWYDRVMFDDLGLTTPTSWEELLQLCDDLNGQGVIPVALGNSEQWPLSLWLDYFVYQYGGASAYEDASFGTDGASFDDPVFVEAGARITELVDAECTPPGFNGLDYRQQTSMFFSGQGGITLLGEWAVPTAAAEAPEGFELDWFFVPDAPGAIYPTGGGEGMAAIPTLLSVAAGQENDEVISAFLNFYGDRTDTETLRLSVAAETPASDDPLRESMIEAAQGVDELFALGGNVPAILAPELLQELQSLSLGEITPEQFGANVAASAERLRPDFESE